MQSVRNAVVIVSIALAGCALKQPPPVAEFRAQAVPNLRTPPQWTAHGGVAAPTVDGWLTSFNDPALDALVREAIEYNSDLRVAAARIDIAAGYVRLSGATLYPQVNALARGGGKMGGDPSGLQ